MLELNKYIKLDEDAVKSANLTSRFSQEDLTAIADAVWEGYQRDLNSRATWEARTNAAMDLAMQIVGTKNFPWPGASNVAFPLVTIAVMQFHARAYPNLISGSNVVKMRVLGEDPEGERDAVARRISSHMSYQVLEEDEGWEPGMDSLLINYSVVGTAFKKARFSGSKSHNVSELVLARDLVVDYWTQDFENCPRKTHVIPFFRNEIWEQVKRGVFRDVLDEAWYQQPPAPRASTTQTQIDQRSGQTPPATDDTTPFTVLEQHTCLDLDGDGYAEPYIISIEAGSKTVLQIACRFERFEEDVERNAKGEIVQIQATEYFERYLFLPSPDGGVYGLGFGVLLGPLNESVNSLVNQLIDAGTMSNSAGGFLARGAKLRGGVYTFAPLEWKRVDSTGDDLKKSIFPLPVREPSTVLFQLLGLLIQYADRIPGTNEANVGENIGQNTPAETARSMLLEGKKVYAAVFKRCWRAMRGEFRKLYRLNSLYLSDQPRRVGGVQISRGDYLADPKSIIPAADPNVTSDELKLSQAQALIEAAYSRPGYDYVAVERLWLRALKVDEAEAVYPGPGKANVPPLGGKDPKVEVQESKERLEMAQMDRDTQLEILQLRVEAEESQAKIDKLRAETMKLLTEMQGEPAKQELEKMNVIFDAMNMKEQNTINRIDLMLKAKKLQVDEKKLEKASAGTK
jgi:chaperonin GroES